MKRVILIIVLLLIILGCTKQTSDISQQALDQELITNEIQIEEDTETDIPINEARGDYKIRRQFSMKITSSAFSNNGRIPVKYTCDGSDVVPPLKFENVPEDTLSLVIIMDDPDAVEVIGYVADHWLVFNIQPTTTTVQEGEEPEGVHGKAIENNLQYVGPCPPDEHRYYFKLYALDTILNLQQGATKPQIENAMQGHILSEATLIGLYG